MARERWTDELHEAADQGAAVAIVHDNITDKYFVDLEAGVLPLKQALIRILKSKHVVFCSLAHSITHAADFTFSTKECKEHFQKAQQKERKEDETPGSKKTQSKDAEGRRLVTQIRAARQDQAHLDVPQTLARIASVLRRPNFATVILRAQNLFRDQSGAKIEDTIEAWCTDSSTMHEDSLVVLVTANLGRLPACVTSHQNGRVRAVSVPLPAAEEFAWILEYKALRDEKVPFEEKDVLGIARAAAEANLRLKEFLDLLDETRRKGGRLTPPVIRNYRYPTSLESASNEQILSLRKKLDEVVVNQKYAKDVLCRALRRAKAGLAKPKRPLAVVLFIGPPGGGETRLGKTLGRGGVGREAKGVRRDMSEYQDSHNAARFGGSPPGYVGYGEGGQLTRRVAAEPCSVVLFDEIEKAHPDVFNTLLQILGEARMTDGEGRTADFSRTIIIMTSNLGSKEAQGKVPEEAEKIYRDAVKEEFRPEFIGRIRKIVSFVSLNEEDILQVTRLETEAVARLLQDRHGCIISVGQEVIKHLARAGMDTEYGARHIETKVEELLTDPLADLILKESPSPGSRISVTLEGEELGFQ